MRRAALSLAVTTMIAAVRSSAEQQCLQQEDGASGATELLAPPLESYSKSGGVRPLFWTPIWRARPPRVDAVQQTEALLQVVDAIRIAQPNGTHKSNLGGWQSPGNLLEISGVASHPAFQKLVAEITTQANAFLDAQARSEGGALSARLTRVWANVNSFGDSNAPHVHPLCHLAGVVYISTGGDPGAKLELMDPRQNL
jgi:uncharacterized protein (TIGR02466 family)